jgi:hypothetical protein
LIERNLIVAQDLLDLLKIAAQIVNQLAKLDASVELSHYQLFITLVKVQFLLSSLSLVLTSTQKIQTDLFVHVRIVGEQGEQVSIAQPQAADVMHRRVQAMLPVAPR